MSLLELQNIHVKLGQQEVLRDVSLRIEAGERVVLMGPSGAGKTTLLRVLAGLQCPSSGQVLLNGQPLEATKASHRGISLLSQDYALYPQLTVGQNIVAALKQTGLKPSEIVHRAEQVESWFGIAELQDRLPSQISGGQSQRVAFAKALARQPQLLLLDEPFSQVDCSLRNQLLEILLPVCSQLKTAICWITHDPQEAFRAASRLAIMAVGRIVQDAAAKSIYDAPKSRLVAELTSVWPVNWLPGDRPEFAELQGDRPHDCVGVRPEHFTFSLDSGFSFDLMVERCQFLGFASLVQGLIGQTPVQLLDFEHRCQPGNQMRIGLDPTKILRFS